MHLRTQLLLAPSAVEYGLEDSQKRTQRGERVLGMPGLSEMPGHTRSALSLVTALTFATYYSSASGQPLRYGLLPKT